MSFEVFITSDFKRESKSLIKKYKSLKTEFFDLITALEENPAQGKENISDKELKKLIDGLD